MHYKYPKAVIPPRPPQNNSSTAITMNLIRFPHRIATTPHEIGATPPPEDPPRKKMIWGEPTWFLFHTLAQRVSEQHFSKIRHELFQLICRICANLPCPDCANHATQYMQGVNFDAITTKEQLKILLWQFHNVVNQKKGFPIFAFENLSKYDRANIGNIIHNFMHHFEQKGHNMRLAAHSFHRGLTITYIRKWFSTYSQYFS